MKSEFRFFSLRTFNCSAALKRDGLGRGGKLIRAARKTERKPSNESKMGEKLVGNRNRKPLRRERSETEEIRGALI